MVSKPSKSSKSNGSRQKNAPSTSNGNDEDEKNKEDRSILRQPMDIGIRGVRDLVKALAGGTQEFQDILLNECSIIYECKICRNLFRSLANFISHKRVYCINKFHYFTHGFSELQNERKPEIVHERRIVVEPEMPQNNPQIETENEAWLTSVQAVENTTETENNTCIVPPQIKTEPYRITRKRDIAKIVDGLSKKGGKEVVKTSQDVPGSVFYSDIAEKVKLRRHAKQKPVIELENVSDTCNGVFQTVKEDVDDSNLDSMRVQVAELNRVVAKNQAILQENGTFTVTLEKSEEPDLTNMDKHKCSFCDAQFITLQTLNRHVSMYHRKLICFQCPLCKEFFPSPNSVYRHLSKAHHKSEQQIRRLRPQILSKASERKLLQPSPKIIPDVNGDLKTLEKEKEKWINNFEGALRCGNCGKSFNRRAVLSVHLSSCKERLPQKPVITQPTPKPVITIQQPSKPISPVQTSKPEIIEEPPKIVLPVPSPKPKILLPAPPTTAKIILPAPPPTPKIILPAPPTTPKIILSVPPPKTKIVSPVQNSKRVLVIQSPKPVDNLQLDKPKAAVKPTSLLNITGLKAVPKLRKTTSPVKSGILVRKDYCKKLTSNSLNSSPSQTNCFYPNDDFSWRHKKVEVLVRKLDSKTMSDLKNSINGSVTVNNNESFLNNKNKAKKSEQRKVEEVRKEKKIKIEKEEKLIQQTVEESEKQPDVKTTNPSEENNEKDGSSTPDVASVKSERLSPVDSVSSTVSSTKTLPYQLRKKKKKSDDEGSSEMETTSNDDTDNKNNDDAKNDSNIENEGGQFPVEKVESVLRRTKRARTLVKNKEFIYNIKKLPPSAKCRTKAIKKAVKHLNYNGSMLLLHKNLSLLKNNGDSKLIKFFPRLL